MPLLAARPDNEYAELDRQVLEARDGGDLRRALTLLMEAYGDDLFDYCSRLCGATHLAEDVLQTVFEEAFRELPTFEARAGLRAWLFVKASRRCLDGLRGVRRWLRLFDAAPVTPEREPMDDQPRPDETLLARSTERLVREALAKLDPRTRLVLLLRFEERFTYAQMEEVFQKDQRRIRKWAEKGVSRLRELLRGYPELWSGHE